MQARSRAEEMTWMICFFKASFMKLESERMSGCEGSIRRMAEKESRVDIVFMEECGD